MDFVTATNTFLDTADYLTDEHAPSVMALRAMAEGLDQMDRVSAAMVGEFCKCHRSLLSLKPKTEDTFSALDSFLAEHAK